MKTWKIILHEYTRHVLRKRFIFALLSVPMWIPQIALLLGALLLFLAVLDSFLAAVFISGSRTLPQNNPEEDCHP